MMDNKIKTELRLEGVAASPGIAIGRVHVIGGDVIEVEKRSIKDVERELKKFQNALNRAKNDLEGFYEKSVGAFGEESAQIFKVHQLMLEDPLIVDDTKAKIKKEKINADYALSEVMDKYIRMLQGMKDEYFKARTADVRDLKKRVIRHIQGSTPTYLTKLKEPVIIFAKELTPSDTIKLERSMVLGFAMDFGGRTSHATILARSIKVPAVVGLIKAGEYLENGDWLILDGDNGVCIINPTQETSSQYSHRYQEYLSFEKKLSNVKKLPARTKDGKDLELGSNIEFPSEIENIQELGSDGVGLYRTEYLFLSGDEVPTEEQQLKEYKLIMEKLNGKPGVIRTFDLGGDKPPKSIPIPIEENPFLGVRGVRLYRDAGYDMLRTQLRALMRASAYGDIRIMFPMISCVSEIRYCRKIVEEIKYELQTENIPFTDNIPFGAMIEVPSAAVTADLIAKECDFLSIGTNDLIQYTIAVDRGNKNLTYLYQQYNPAVFRLIKDVIEKGHYNGAWVGMCGEMASDPLTTMVLIGLGIDEFSVSPVSHLMIKEIIRNVEYSECESIAQTALSYSTSGEIEEYLKAVYHKKFKNLLFSA